MAEDGGSQSRLDITLQAAAACAVDHDMKRRGGIAATAIPTRSPSEYYLLGDGIWVKDRPGRELTVPAWMSSFL